MRVTTLVSLVMVLVVALAGCDGRGGSSGLDITENAVIDRALEKRQCLDYQTLRICAADVAATDTPSIDTPLADATSIDCFQAIPDGTCTFALTFTPRAFPANTTFNALARADGSGNPWVLGSDPVADDNSDPTTYTATLDLASPHGGAPNLVQFAVLAFAGSSSSPSEVDELHQTTATFAFVTQVLAVHVVTPTPVPTVTRIATNTATPTPTPGPSDCCQCAASCAAPVDGACDPDCTVVYGTSCFGDQFCVARTPTPTIPPSPTPTGCLTDNGDGTIMDNCTGLMWEKKGQAGGLHNFSDRYPWAGECEHDDRTLCQPDAESAAACAEATNGALGCSQCPPGVACTLRGGFYGPATATIWGWLVELNQGEGFAGHTDWRIPSVGEGGDVAELETILLPACSVGSPCVPAAFNTNCDPGRLCGENQPCRAGQVCVQRPEVANPTCQDVPGCEVTSCSCTWTQYYWSASTDVSTSGAPPGYAWFLDFSSGAVISGNERNPESVRAVRGIRTPRPTSTPAVTDCCQCASSCAAPVDGSCGDCAIVTDSACDGGSMCIANTPTATPTPCLRDNGDGTITDGCTKLTWEKKDEAGGLHDNRTLYTWAGACTGNTSLCQPNAAASAACIAQTGGAVGCNQCASGGCIVDPTHNGATTTIWDWLSQLNAVGFAGYGDWRIPTVGYEGDTVEFETILGPTTSPCQPVLPEFDVDCTSGCLLTECSCTAISYWAATTFLAAPGNAEELDFINCESRPGVGIKTNAYSVRAVHRDQ